MSNNISLLLGSGSSIPAGFRSTEELTNMFLCGYGIWKDSQGRYFIDNNLSEKRRQYFNLEERLDLVKFVIRWLHEETQKYHRTFAGRQANYEDVFYLSEQISHDMYGERENPAIYSFMKELKSRFNNFINSSDQRESLHDFSNISTEVCNCILDVVVNTLSHKASQTNHLKIIKYICEEYEPVCVATLSHDIHVETFLEEEEVTLADGVSKKDGVRQWDGNFIVNDKIPFLKLHGSINWNWNCLSENFNRPEILVGTFNKLAKYGSEIFIDLHYHFKTIIHESDTMIICGYSFGDKGINSTIINWYHNKPGRRFVIIHPCKDQMIASARPAIQRLFGDQDPWTMVHRPGAAFGSTKYIHKKLQHVTVNEIRDAIAS